MNLKVKKVLLCSLLACMTLAVSPIIGASANNITSNQIVKTPNSITGLTYAYAYTGTEGGYAAAQIYGYGSGSTASGVLSNTAEGYNTYAQTQQISYRASYYNSVVGRHWSSTQYAVSY